MLKEQTAAKVEKADKKASIAIVNLNAKHREQAQQTAHRTIGFGYVVASVVTGVLISDAAAMLTMVSHRV